MRHTLAFAKRFSPLFLSAALLAIPSLSGLAQERPRFEMADRQQSEVSFECHELAPAYPDSSSAIVLFRIRPLFFTYVRTQSAQGLESYRGHGQLVAELVDEHETSVASQVRSIELTYATPPQESAQPPDYQSFVLFTVPPGRYTVVLELKDGESSKSFLNKSQTLSLHAGAGGRSIVAGPILVEPADSARRTVVPLNNGGRVILGSAGGILVQTGRAGATKDLKWTIIPEQSDNPVDFRKEEGSSAPVRIGKLVPVDEGNHPSIEVLPDSNGSPVYSIPLPLRRLETGVYKLALRTDTTRTAPDTSVTLRIFWPNRPFSLSNPVVAIDALQHIATREELDELSSLSSRSSIVRFNDFWRKRNTDSTSAYNPVMAEYYRRVDDAIRRFSTHEAMDGYKSDRGRILILFGTPTRIEKLLKPGSVPAELWRYDRLRKSFTFTDRDRSGNYVLIKVEDL